MGRLTRGLLPAFICLVLPAVASAAAPKPLQFDVTIGAANDQKCLVDGTLYTPDGVSKDNPVPAILATNGFGGSKDDLAKLGASYAKRGYVFLAYSGLGFGKSGCKITLDDPDTDGKAGSQLVSFLGGSKAARDGTKVDYVMRDEIDHNGVARADDPRIGMTGGSYGGQIQFAIAQQDARLDTIQPQITWNDLSYSLTGSNTDFDHGVTTRTPGVSKVDWPVLFTGLGVADGVTETIANNDSSHLDGTCPNFEPRVCPGLVNSGVLGYPDAATIGLLRHASVDTYMAKIKIPTFLRQGQHDSLFNLQEATANWRALRAQNTPVKMLWRSNGHSGGGIGTAESDSTNLEKAYESRLELQWFEYYLRGAGEPPPLDFSFLLDHVPYKGDAAPAVGVTPSYPAGSDRTLSLSGSDALVAPGTPAAKGSASMLSIPVVPTSEGGPFTEQVPAFDLPGTSVSFTGTPLTTDFDVVGIPSVTVHLDAPTFAAAQSADPVTKLVLFAKLYDVDGSGAATLPAGLLSAARVADVTKPVTIQLPGIVHRFAKGHRLRLTLATSNATGRNSATPGPVTVAVDPATPSTLTIPRLGAMDGALGAGPSGMTRYVAAPGSPPSQPAGLGGPPPVKKAEKAGRPPCTSGRRFRLTLPRAPRGDRIVSTTVTMRGKRLKIRGGRRPTVTVDLTNRPKGAYRVVITQKLRKGKTRRTSRTFHTCGGLSAG